MQEIVPVRKARYEVDMFAEVSQDDVSCIWSVSHRLLHAVTAASKQIYI